MSRIAFFCIPAHGHTNPTLPVVRSLTAQGHEVTYYSFEPFREAIESAGARFFSCDTGGIGTAADGGAATRDILVSTRLIVDTTLALQNTVLPSLEALRPDVIVADSVAFWGKLFAAKLGIPCVCSCTTFAFNTYSARIMKTSPGALIGMLVKLPLAGRLLKPLRAQGYPVRSAMDLLQSDDSLPTVVYTSPEFQPCSETFPETYSFVGPCLNPVAEPMAKPARPLVYVSMGTVLDGEDRFYRHCAEALGDGRYEVILSVGGSRMPADLPENIRAFPRVDQLAVLGVADAFITHCGMNSVSEALYCGVPLITRPLTPEEGGVAARAEALGAGLPLGSDDPAAIRAAVDRVIDRPEYRDSARRLGEGFRRCGGAQAAARVILNAAAGNSPTAGK